jgi:hypothetical protein
MVVVWKGRVTEKLGDTVWLNIGDQYSASVPLKSIPVRWHKHLIEGNTFRWKIGTQRVLWFPEQTVSEFWFAAPKRWTKRDFKRAESTRSKLFSSIQWE